MHRQKPFLIHVEDQKFSHESRHEYSHLSNKRGGWNKRGGGAKNAKNQANDPQEKADHSQVAFPSLC